MAWPGILACLGLFWLKSASISLVAISLLRWQVLDICKDVSAPQGAHLNQKLRQDHAYKPKSFTFGDLGGPKKGQILLTKFFRQGDKTSWQNMKNIKIKWKKIFFLFE